jgi:integrase/recombinase XerD
MNFTSYLNQFADEMNLVGKSPRTLQIYCHQVERFLNWYQKCPSQVTIDEIKQYQQWMIKVARMSWANFNQSVCALRFFVTKILRLNFEIKHITYHRKEQKHPQILSKEEIERLLKVSVNTPRWYCAIALLYGTGMRLGELSNLQMTEIDGKQGLIHISNGKGAKERQVPLSEELYQICRKYYKSCTVKPSKYLFSGASPDKKLDPSAIQKALTRLGQRAGIKKQVSPHVFRHSYATHSLEQGMDLRTLQVILGHNHITTTTAYLQLTTQHLKKAVNPLQALLAQSGALQ